MYRIYFLLFAISASGCTIKNSDSPYLRHVGDIESDAVVDDLEFQPCHGDDNIAQYFNFSQGFQYEGEKRAIIDDFKEKYTPVASQDSGLLRIRFIVNCQGETGRFRLMGMNESYEKKKFHPSITDQLLQITKELGGWKILPDQENPRDYYQYLTFKIESGKIMEILP